MRQKRAADGDDWHRKISQPRYRSEAERKIRVPMRDGVHLSVDVFRPDTRRGRFPALIAFSPYWNDGQYLEVPQGNPHPYSGWGNFAIECGDTRYLVERGYVHVIANVRGTGDSEGEFQLMGELEARDGYDLVEWVASQPWCNGNVGMVGVSYFSWIQYLVAAQQPPHLKAIMPLEGATDFYRHVCYHGGILSLGFLLYWSTEITDPNNIIQSAREFTRAELQSKIRELKQNNEDVLHLYALYHLLRAPKKNPLLFDTLIHPNDGSWYHQRSPYTHFDKVKVPVFCGAPLDFCDLHLPGGFSAWEGIQRVPKKFLIYPKFHERPFHENHDLIVRWYDHWLKGNDTGVMDKEPPIALWVQGRNLWRYENEWPLARTKWTKYYLRAGGELSKDPPRDSEGATDSFENVPYLDMRALEKPLPRLSYSSRPLETDVEVTGPIALYLFASLTNTDGNWIAEISDLSDDSKQGSSRRIITKGWLKASFRALDRVRSKPYRPWHPHTHPRRVEPGKVYEYAIQIHDNSNVFLVGHRILLEIKTIDHSLEGGWNTIFYHLPCAKQVTHTVYHTQAYPSHLLLPVIPRTGGR